MGTTTPNLGLTKPTVGGDAEVWATYMNSNLDTLDAQVQVAIEASANCISSQSLTASWASFTVTADQNNFELDGSLYQRSITDAACNITGFTVIDPLPRVPFTLINVGSFTLTLKNSSTSSIASNRILTGTGADLAIATNQSVIIAYDLVSSRWRVVAKNF